MKYIKFFDSFESVNMLEIDDFMEIHKIENYAVGQYHFDVKNQLLTHIQGDKKLTKKETRILNFLCEHLNDIAPRELILQSIWGNDDYFSGRSMDVFISKLRKYLSFDPTIKISNIHGVGFKLEVGV